MGTKETKKIDAIILAAGSLERGYDKEFPKALFKIGNKTLAEYQIEFLKPHVNKIIMACTEKEAKEIKKKVKGKVVFATTSDLPGTSGSLKKALEFATTNQIIVINVDDLTDIDLRALINFGTNTVCVANPRLQYGVVEIDGQEIKSFHEKPILKNVWVNCGVYFLNKDIAKKLPKRGNIARDIFPYMKLKAYRHFGSWRTINDYTTMLE